jgi:hypothetical protein
MTMRPLASNRGFTLAELIVSMTLGMIVMLAVFSTYLYLGRNLTRLSYRSVLEGQSRKILNVFATDIRNTTSIVSASASGLTLKTIHIDPITKVQTAPVVTYVYNSAKLSRDPDGSGPVILNNDIGDANVQVPVTIPSFSFLYYNTNGSAVLPNAPISIKQVALSFTLQAGVLAIQGQQGTLSSYPVASGKMPLINRPLPDGS